MTQMVTPCATNSICREMKPAVARKGIGLSSLPKFLKDRTGIEANRSAAATNREVALIIGNMNELDVKNALN